MTCVAGEMNLELSSTKPERQAARLAMRCRRRSRSHGHRDRRCRDRKRNSHPTEKGSRPTYAADVRRLARASWPSRFHVEADAADSPPSGRRHDTRAAARRLAAETRFQSPRETGGHSAYRQDRWPRDWRPWFGTPAHGRATAQHARGRRFIRSGEGKRPRRAHVPTKSQAEPRAHPCREAKYRQAKC